MKRFSAALPAGLIVLLPHAALAHPGHGEASGLAQGLLHPVGGADHMLAMVAVGLLAAFYGGRALWALPLSFLGMMTLGAGLGITGLALPYVEIGIGLSVVAFGLALALRVAAPLAALMALVGGFAVFHGYAHGAEMPESASGLAYGLGFLAATAALHLAGLGLGRVLNGRQASLRILPQVLGGALTVAGLALLVQAA
ncbi:HupE/UreJ family protein [Methylorubrum zatmanii]|uniref:HupE/UreJ family protein n=1 Tax=Methylorubrum zatmanii TaxID=29429 RepID=A0ABW1WQ64_9HYPH|nr:HupE/UreJ family protein [Methylorubrum zatmanii]MBD8905582.1 urease accessory protein [Methylorubrum zatmanii]